MSLNLLDLLEDKVTASLAIHASSFLDEPKEKVTHGLHAVFPTLLGTVIHKSTEPSGNTQLMDLIGGLDLEMLGDIGGLFGGGAGNVNSLLKSGDGIVNSLLGDKVSSIATMIGKVTGLKSGSSTSLLKIAAPFLLGLIEKQIKGKGLSFLSDLLMGQKDYVQEALPAGLGGILGFTFSANDTGNIATEPQDKIQTTSDRIQDDISQTLKSTSSASAHSMQNVSHSTEETAIGATSTLNGSAGNRLSWIKWLLPVLLIGALALWALTSGWFGDTAHDMINGVSYSTDKTTKKIGEAANTPKEMTKDTYQSGSSTANGTMNDVSDIAKSAFASVDEAAKSALDKITFSENSVGSQLMDYIKSGFKGEGKVTFKRLTFKTGSAQMDEKSAKEVDNLAAILRAYPKVNINIIGHTDNVGDEKQNKVLSQGRATAIKARLMDQGIDGVRITTYGLGSEQPIASNDTEEGRALNRRIEVTIAS